MNVTQGRESTPAAEHRTVARVMSLLELVLASDSQGVRLGELSESIDAPKSSVHGLAKGLVAVGYLREEGGRYFVGPAISSVLAVGPSSLPSIYRHALEHLSRTSGETAMLASMVGDSVVYLDAVEPAAFIRAAPVVNKRLPLWPRSAGKCFVAFMEPRKMGLYLRRNRDAPEDTAELQAELAKIRETHIALNVGQSFADHLGIASPVIMNPASVNVALAIVGPRTRMEDKVEDISQSLLETARSFTAGATAAGH